MIRDFIRKGKSKKTTRELIRVAVAALLNASHPVVEFPLTTTELIHEVNTALASRDQDIIADLTAALGVLDGGFFERPLPVPQ